MKKIPLWNKKGEIIDYALCSDEDYDELMKYRWHRYLGNRHIYYAKRATPMKEFGRQRTVLMHRQILGVLWDNSIQVDHKNSNGLDNTRENIRLCTPSQNAMNRTRRHASSKYSGVKFRGLTSKKKNPDGTYYTSICTKPWRVDIMVQGKKIHGGSYATEIEAALAYDKLAIQYHGEFAKLNFPQKENPSDIDGLPE